MLNLKKIAMGLFVLGQFGVISNSFSAPAQSNTQVVKRFIEYCGAGLCKSIAGNCELQFQRDVKINKSRHR